MLGDGELNSRLVLPAEHVVRPVCASYVQHASTCLSCLVLSVFVAHVFGCRLLVFL